MKVIERNPIAPIQKISSERGPVARARANVSVPDRVSLSQEAQRMQKANMERVAAIAHQVAEGRYPIDLDRLAKAIVAKENL